MLACVGALHQLHGGAALGLGLLLRGERRARTASCALACWALAASREASASAVAFSRKLRCCSRSPARAGELGAGLGELVFAGGEALGEVGDAVGVGGGAGGDAFELDGGLVGAGAGVADLLVELVARGDACGVLGVHLLRASAACASICAARRAIFGGDRGLLGVHLREAAGEDDAELGAELVAESAVALGLGGLALERGHLLGDFFEDVVDAREVLLGGLEAELGEALFGLEAGDAGGFFDDAAAVEGLGVEELADALLADDGVGFAAEAGAHEDVLDVAEAADFAVEQVLGVAGAEEAAGDGDFAGTDGGAAELAAADLEDDVVGGVGEDGVGAEGSWLGWPPRSSSSSSMASAAAAISSGVACSWRTSLLAAGSFVGLPGWASATASSVSAAASRRAASSSQSPASLGDVLVVDDELRASPCGRQTSVVDFGVDEGERDFGHAGGLAVAGAGEDDVFHLDAAEAFGGLLAEDPGDGVRDVGLAAAVGTDDGGDALAGELDFGAVAERFEAENLDFIELEQRGHHLENDWQSAQIHARVLVESYAGGGGESTWCARCCG